MYLHQGLGCKCNGWEMTGWELDRAGKRPGGCPESAGREPAWYPYILHVHTETSIVHTATHIASYTQARSQPSRWGGGLNLDGWNTIQARVQDFLKGGGGWKHSQAPPPPPWTLSAWRHPPYEKLKNTPTLGHSQAPPPLDSARVTSSTFQGGGGGGDRSRSRTLCIGVQYRDKFKGGGVIIPVTPPPRIRHCYIQGMVGLSISWQKQGV